MSPTHHLRFLKRNDDNPPVLQQRWIATVSMEEGWVEEWRDVPIVIEQDQTSTEPAMSGSALREA